METNNSNTEQGNRHDVRPFHKNVLSKGDTQSPVKVNQSPVNVIHPLQGV